MFRRSKSLTKEEEAWASAIGNMQETRVRGTQIFDDGKR